MSGGFVLLATIGVIAGMVQAKSAPQQTTERKRSPATQQSANDTFDTGETVSTPTTPDDTGEVAGSSTATPSKPTMNNNAPPVNVMGTISPNVQYVEQPAANEQTDQTDQTGTTTNPPAGNTTDPPPTGGNQ